MEKPGTGWVQIGEPEIKNDPTTSTTTYSYTFTNSITTSYSVEKKWNPTTATKHDVTVGLYRTTNQSQVGSTTGGTPVPEDELAPNGDKRTVTLSGNTWTHTFTNLPKYDANGNLYYYYALELNGTTPIAQHGTITLGTTDYEVSYDWEPTRPPSPTPPPPVSPAPRPGRTTEIITRPGLIPIT